MLFRSDGNEQDGDGCSAECVVEYCGDGAETLGDIPVRVEGFEHGVLTPLLWTLGDPYGFEPTTDQARGGVYAVGSTNANVSSSASSLAIDAYSDGEICFWYAGRSETSYDFLVFLVDGDEVFETSGTISEWTEECQAVDPGVHTFEWRYEKDGYGSSGIDRFFIDDIRFATAYIEQCDQLGDWDPGDGCTGVCQSE